MFSDTRSEEVVYVPFKTNDDIEDDFEDIVEDVNEKRVTDKSRYKILRFNKIAKVSTMIINITIQVLWS